jgi:hypothetical protein
MLNNGWLTRRPSNRAFTITNLGAEQLIQLGIDPASPASPLPMGPSGLEDHSTFPTSDPRSQASYWCTPNDRFCARPQSRRIRKCVQIGGDVRAFAFPG